MEPAQLDNFESAFSEQSSGMYESCECGRVFYDNVNQWDWEDGEFERLQSDPNATAVNYGVGRVVIERKYYVKDCDCWHTKANQIIRWLIGHEASVATFLSLEKKRKQFEADHSPVVE